MRRDAEGRFVLGFALMALGGGRGRRRSPRPPPPDRRWPGCGTRRARASSSTCARATGGSASPSLDAPRELRTIVPVGAALPLDRGSAGKVLRDEPAVGRAGWAESVAEREVGVASVSAPVRDAAGAVVAAVSVSGPIERLTRQPGRRYGAAVVAAARGVETAVGRPPPPH